MNLENLPDDFTVQDFMRLDKESLDKVPYTIYKWVCQCSGCNNGTRVRDYGLTEFNPRGIWAFLDRNSKYANKNPGEYWMGPNNIWLCGKHFKLVKRLEKRFDTQHIRNRLFDEGKIVLIPIDANKMQVVRQIENVTNKKQVYEKAEKL